MQRIETPALELGDPAGVYLMQRHGIEVVQFFPPLPYDSDEIGVFKQLQVLRHGLPRHVHVFAQRSERLAIVGVELVKQTPATGVGERLEDFVKVQIVFR